MPKFLTISPTHVLGKKPFAWNNFYKGHYVAIGWMDIDLTGWDIEKIISYIKEQNFPNEDSAISSFKKFIALEIGDFVAANNVNYGLFGVGKVISDYKFKLHIHDSGDENINHHYSHYREVDWLITEYLPREKILRHGEKPWPPYGTTGTLEPELPDYIKRLLGEKPSEEEIQEDNSKPITSNFLAQLIEHVNELRRDPAHQERAHESLVEDFLVLLGYQKHSDIKYRQSRIDITVWDNENPLLLLEVKREWNLNWETHASELKQAYGYSYDKGIRYILLTNGDYYAFFDRVKGLSYEKNLVGEFQLSSLQMDDIQLINKLKKENLTKTSVSEILKNISEIFE
ncbi:MAG: hypothetical protein A2Z50_00085 [Nitrospirae bacterium RBG_19FT_COMBO_42_15]|nr:MAG: hypothetical protein A2Z50_00085 [Nitrospirae bacterium RBG_19FT_COMBO_42_15]